MSGNKSSCKVLQNGTLKEMTTSNKRGNRIFKSLDDWMKDISHDITLKNIYVTKSPDFSSYYDFLYSGDRRNMELVRLISMEVNLLHPFLRCDLLFINYLKKLKDLSNTYYKILDCNDYKMINYARNNIHKLYEYNDLSDTIGYPVITNSFADYKKKINTSGLTLEELYKLYRDEEINLKNDFIPFIKEFCEYLRPKMLDLSVKNLQNNMLYKQLFYINSEISRITDKIINDKKHIEFLENSIGRLRMLKNIVENKNTVEDNSNDDNSVYKELKFVDIDSKIENIEKIIIPILKRINQNEIELERQKQIKLEKYNNKTQSDVVHSKNLFYSI
jgi:hypothetical protein